MKKLLNIMLVFALFAPFSFGSASSDYYESSYARMSYVKGDVYIQRAEDLGYEEGVVNLALIQGDKIGTREGRTEIHLGDGNYIRMDRNTQIEFVRMPNSGEDITGFHILSGCLFLRIDFTGNNKTFEVHSPDASFYILEEGLYYLSIMQNDQTEIRVFEGSAEAAGEEGSLLLKAEEMAVVSNGRFVSEATYFSASMGSSFFEWNSSRDAFHSRHAGGTSYLPSELNEYESELAYYGQWSYHNSYGYVWVPHGISRTWRPYLNGRWVWYPIIGWTWVSYEPWGWCVSHYGRWHWSVRFGWYWIPTRSWGPAWVYWYHGPSYVGWCPLSYYGYPGVIINNHYYGNHYHSHYPSGSSALVVVRKDHLQARNISSVVLSKASVSKLSNITMSSAQPKAMPNAHRMDGLSSKAVKMFSDSKIRGVTKSYSTGRSLNPSQNYRSSGMRSAPDIKTNSSGNTIRAYPSRELRNSTSSARNSRSAGSMPGMRSSGTSTPSRSSGSLRKSSAARYPSRMSSSSTSSRLRSSGNTYSGGRTASSGLRNRSASSSSSASSYIRRNRSVPSVSSRTARQNSSGSQRISTSGSRSGSVSSRKITSRSKTRNSSSSRVVRSSSSRTRSSSSRVRSSSSRTRSSSSRARSSSTRVRRSSSSRSTGSARARTSSRSSSTRRSRKK